MYRNMSNVRPAAPAVAVSAKPPIMKFRQAAKTADKNSRTIVKIQQLLEITQMTGYKQSDPDGHVTIRIEQLKKRLNRRLTKVAKWVDCPSEDRQVEFRNFRSSIQPTSVVNNSTFAYRGPTAAPQVPMTAGRYPGQPQYLSGAAAYQQRFGPGAASTSSSASLTQSRSITQTAFNAQQSHHSIHSTISNSGRGVEESKSSEIVTATSASSTANADAVANNIDVVVLPAIEPSLTTAFSAQASIAAAPSVEAPAPIMQ